ncbi:hypothetical protein TRVA0_019S00540 [Trichomonascus vanleenenianus]|uniref:uncharacterized protein n=1 Tax=Trichomonascus vanleenenianus TaxID=2268995 RepID=UPI003ECAF385
MSTAYDWLWEKEVLQGLIEAIRKTESPYAILTSGELEGQQYTYWEVRWQVGQKDYYLTLLFRDVYKEILALIEDLNGCSNRKSVQSPIKLNQKRHFSDELFIRACGWYTKRNYVLMAHPCTGKTGFVISTLLLRTLFGLPTIVYPQCTEHAFLIDKTLGVCEFEPGEQDPSNQFSQLRWNRNVWVFLDNQYPTANMTCKSWVHIHLVNYNSMKEAQAKDLASRNRLVNPAMIYVDTWSWTDLRFICRVLRNYEDGSMVRAKTLFYNYDPFGALVLNEHVSCNSDNYKNTVQRLESWLERKFTYLCHNQTTMTMLSRQCYDKLFNEVVIRKPSLYSNWHKHISLRVHEEISTAYIGEQLVLKAFELKLSYKIVGWLRDLTSSCDNTMCTKHIIGSLVQYRLVAGGRYGIYSCERNDSSINKLEFILRPSKSPKPDFYSLPQLLSKPNGTSPDSTMLNKFMSPDHDTNLGEPLQFAVCNIGPALRLVVFQVHCPSVLQKTYAEELLELWDAMPIEAKTQKPILVAISVDTNYEAQASLVKKKETPEEFAKYMRKVDMSPDPVVSSLESDDCNLEKALSLYTLYKMNIDLNTLLRDDFSTSMKLSWMKDNFKRRCSGIRTSIHI